MDDFEKDFKEGMKQFHLDTVGTLEETDDSYSFEDSWNRFNSALTAACSMSAEQLDAIKGTQRKKSKRSK